MIIKIATAIIAAVIHAALLATSTLVWMGSGWERIDHPEMKTGWMEFLSAGAAYILGAPIVTTIFLLRIKGLPIPVQWTLFGLNSLIWGFLVMWICFYGFPRIRSRIRNHRV